jgi:hypothetical protein
VIMECRLLLLVVKVVVVMILFKGRVDALGDLPKKIVGGCCI